MCKVGEYSTTEHRAEPLLVGFLLTGHTSTEFPLVFSRTETRGSIIVIYYAGRCVVRIPYQLIEVKMNQSKGIEEHNTHS